MSEIFMDHKFEKIVLNVPHASLEGFYDKSLSGWDMNAYHINLDVMKWTDLYTDFIFGYDDSRIEMVRAQHSRFIVDFERLQGDDLEAEGNGIVYERFGTWKRSGLTDEMRQQLMGLWKEYHQKLLKAVEGDKSLLIDCHSFPSSHCRDIDICIGFNDDYTTPDSDLIDIVVGHFKEYGYRVGVNAPYSNAIDPLRNCGVDTCDTYNFKSIMIEVSKRTYMNELHHTINVNSHFATQLSNAIKTLYHKILI